MTPTPIPEEFTKAMHARAVQYGGGRSGYESFTDGAEWAYRHLLASQQTMRWVKAELSQNWKDKTGEFVIKSDIRDKYKYDVTHAETILFWLQKGKEIYFLVDEEAKPKCPGCGAGVFSLSGRCPNCGKLLDEPTAPIQ